LILHSPLVILHSSFCALHSPLSTLHSPLSAFAVYCMFCSAFSHSHSGANSNIITILATLGIGSQYIQRPYSLLLRTRLDIAPIASEQPNSLTANVFVQQSYNVATHTI
jgi:hypothetical protein